MANSVLTQIKVKDEKPASTVSTPQTPHAWELKKTPEGQRNAVTFTHTFESRDQAVAVCRILSHQVDLLRKHALSESESQLPYLSDILGDYSRILETMLQKIENSTISNP